MILEPGHIGKTLLLKRPLQTVMDVNLQFCDNAFSVATFTGLDLIRITKNTVFVAMIDAQKIENVDGNYYSPLYSRLKAFHNAEKSLGLTTVRKQIDHEELIERLQTEDIHAYLGVVVPKNTYIFIDLDTGVLLHEQVEIDHLNIWTEDDNGNELFLSIKELKKHL
jgi:hypothetical protein